jgi:hypothetical protein
MKDALGHGSNAYNTGIGHLGKSGRPGAQAACGHRGAHFTMSMQSFEAHDKKCVKCSGKFERLKQIAAKNAARIPIHDSMVNQS